MRIPKYIKQGVIRLEDEFYPPLLRDIKDPPDQLFYAGSLNRDTFKNTVSVVGSRMISAYGKEVLERLVPELVGNGLSVVSGLARGVDIHAHKAVLKHHKHKNVTKIVSGSVPIVVMPCGIGKVTPVQHTDILLSLLEIGGIAISEYSYDHPPYKWTYPQRNRIIAGLSKATIIIEAKKKGGSQNTASHTKVFERELFCIPGDITNSNSEGTNELIKDGAKLLSSSKDITTLYSPTLFDIGKAKSPKRSSFSKQQNIIIDLIEYAAYDIDALSRKVSLPMNQLSVEISKLEIKGVLVKRENRYYVS